jgi:hypothetical protein
VSSKRLTRGKTPSIWPSGARARDFEILVLRLLPSPVPYSRSREAVNCRPLSTAFMPAGETQGRDEIHVFGSARLLSGTDSLPDFDSDAGRGNWQIS